MKEFGSNNYNDTQISNASAFLLLLSPQSFELVCGGRDMESRGLLEVGGLGLLLHKLNAFARKKCFLIGLWFA